MICVLRSFVIAIAVLNTSADYHSCLLFCKFHPFRSTESSSRRRDCKGKVCRGSSAEGSSPCQRADAAERKIMYETARGGEYKDSGPTTHGSRDARQRDEPGRSTSARRAGTPRHCRTQRRATAGIICRTAR